MDPKLISATKNNIIHSCNANFCLIGNVLLLILNNFSDL